MNDENLLIVSYIGVLVISQKYSDAIRAIEIVIASEPNDPLLLGNLYKLNALSIMKSETVSFTFQTASVN